MAASFKKGLFPGAIKNAKLLFVWSALFYQNNQKQWILGLMVGKNNRIWLDVVKQAERKKSACNQALVYISVVKTLVNGREVTSCLTLWLTYYGHTRPIMHGHPCYNMLSIQPSSTQGMKHSPPFHHVFWVCDFKS